jgi:hypothetical protein
MGTAIKLLKEKVRVPKYEVLSVKWYIDYGSSGIQFMVVDFELEYTEIPKSFRQPWRVGDKL